MPRTEVSFNEISQTKLLDRATGGECLSTHISIKEYVDLVEGIYAHSNEFQRNVINIKRSLIYQKLVKDLLKGVVIPTISILINDEIDIESNRVLINKSQVQILDGLQRTNCIIYALKLLKGEIIDELGIIEKTPNILTENEFLESIIRVEIWNGLSVNGILYKMVSLNAGQTPMDLNHQFEILELPLKKELSINHDITVYTKAESIQRRENFGFNLSDLVEGLIAYNTESIFPKKQSTAISIMDSLDVANTHRESSFLKNDYLIQDLVWVIKDFHEAIKIKYNDEPYNKYKSILSESEVFFIPFMAALGKARKELDEESFNSRKDDLIALLNSRITDPLDLIFFDEITSIANLKSNVGQKRRKVVYYSFYLFFNSATKKIDWSMGLNII